ncbi:hypothetical protein F5X96DRAFT_642884 [Biscogniauxia mediterranea]|nr:hypothetical protein F5X96DRAFT_642884 [Biscogniauxia mediterranea]
MALRPLPLHHHHHHHYARQLLSASPLPPWGAGAVAPRSARSSTRAGPGSHHRRFFSASSVSDPANLVQVYVSRLTDPYLNLSVEHFLLQRTPVESVVLLLYANRPCVVVGRNQNPWVEADLGLLREPGVLRRLRHSLSPSTTTTGEDGRTNAENDDDDDSVLLVRRRSGGGAVFHDAGNANWAVIMPSGSFDRTRHAEMVVRALGGAGRGCRVNERHDIVIDVPSPPSPSSHSSTSPSSSPPSPPSTPSPSTPSTTPTTTSTYKISGSAYKLTRQRALHHGTCLLASPHLGLVGRLLRSPAAPYVLARGVESVRSPVRNVGSVGVGAFEDAVVAEFAAMYGPASGGGAVVVLGGGGGGNSVSEDEIRRIPEIMKGYEELKSPEWIYAQTPQFAFSTHASSADPRPRPAPPSGLRLSMTVRHGQIAECEADDLGSSDQLLRGKHLHLVRDWREYVPGERGEWLNGIFGGGGGGGVGDDGSN